ncbi:MAG: type IV pilus twitching motility protein PilT [Elusimicrobia bacterium]|nr:type IV pilus twitching motility protein PilT [Elusimicrobiota bacterium]MBK7544234.1 type IV pilus twitching motility protein PilT [Elusimicrobiota bacterium]MBK7573756.1 type IV pilus twitching motility protein PilT [Elusimicrobiota bacterium]MBK7689354.1 type IV pilus twitching motility protein PilT [Elusimicrobiota bacterium]MBK8125900.1 type IV pilus twitching motility protein PilT [Elusimicrobiota bacterium]
MDARQILQTLLKEVDERKASDLHVGPGFIPMLRLHGDLEPSKIGQPLTAEETRNLAYFIMGEKVRARFEQKNEVDLAFSVSGGPRFRVNIYTQRGLVNLALRAIPSQIPTIRSLGLPSSVEKMADNRRGLILVSGTTGSGKSTTLAAIVDQINVTRKAHILTIEDPIEFVHKNKKSIVNQRELGLDTSNYADALRSAMREDPNVILVGEMRDLETVSAAITAAQTGHLVLSTIHTTNTIQIISRILDLYPPHQQAQVRLQLAETLKGAIAQRLLPLADGSGRVAAQEIMVVTPHIQKAIEENSLMDVYNAIRTGKFYGMQTFNQAMVLLYNQGKIKLEEGMAAASNPEEFMLAVRGIEAGANTPGFVPE